MSILLLGIIISLSLGVAVAFLLEYLENLAKMTNQGISSEEDNLDARSGKRGGMPETVS
jgi:hypothetical protein